MAPTKETLGEAVVSNWVGVRMVMVSFVAGEGKMKREVLLLS